MSECIVLSPQAVVCVTSLVEVAGRDTHPNVRALVVTCYHG
jgi:hypothetical protein